MWDLEQNADLPVKEEDKILCPLCLAENKADAEYCCKCNAPIGLYSTVDPVQSAVAEGRAITDGIQEPKKPIVVVGMIIIWGIPFIITSTFAIYALLSLQVVAFLVVGALSTLFGIFLIKSILNYLKYNKSKSPSVDNDEMDSPDRLSR